MTTELVTKKEDTSSINWDKVMLVRYNSITGERIILTSGRHTDDEFSGTMIIDTVSTVPSIGEHCNNWSKACFLPITASVVISFNQD